MDVEWLREWGGLIGKYSAVKGKGMDRFINIFRGICVFVFGKGQLEGMEGFGIDIFWDVEGKRND